MPDEAAVAPDPFDTVWEQATGTDEQAPVEETEGAAAEPVESTSEPAAQPRDEQGRFVKVETAPAEPTPETADADAVSPEPPAETPTEPEEPAAPDPEKDWEALPAFSYRAHGEDVVIPGSKLGPAGVYIPTDQVQEIARTLSSGREYHRRAQEWDGKVKAAEERVQQTAKAKEAADAVRDEILRTLDALAEQGKLIDWATQAETEWPILRAKAVAKGLEVEKQALQAQLESRDTTLKTQREAEERARLRPIMDRTLKDTIHELGTAAGLSVDDLDPLYTRLRSDDLEAVVFPVADRDYPDHGISAGQRFFNREPVQREIEILAGIVKRYKQPTPPPAITKAAAANAKKATPEPKAPPPTVAAKRGPAPAAGKRPTFKSTEEVDAWFERGGYHEAFEE